MKTTVSNHDFHRAFETTRPNSFTYQGLNALFAYLEEYEDSTGEEIELDVIAICCDFTEYENREEFQEDYGNEFKTLEDIEENTIVIPISDGSFIIQQF